MPEPLADLVVVEVSGDVATRYCGKLFAEHGARVITAYRPENGRLGYGGDAGAAYAAWLDSRKEFAGELPAGIAPDLVIAGQTPEDIATAETLVGGFVRQPLLLALTWFGRTGPSAEWHGSDGIIQAMSGIAYAFGPVAGPPVLPQGHAPQVVGGTTAFIATLAALYDRRLGGVAQRVDVSVLEAFLCLTENGGPALAQGGPASRRRGVNRFGPVYPQSVFAAADGWIGVTALTPQQWQTLCDLVGMPELARDPAFATTDLRMAASARLDTILEPALRKLNAAKLLLEGQSRRLPLGPVPSMAELLQTPHWRERQSFRTVGAAGSPIVAPAMPFRLHVREPAASLAAGAKAPRLLAGLRVLDLSMGWSGPLCGRHFADLGADVVKVEGCAHMDWWRGWNALEAGDPPPYETRANFNAVNRNKRGITLDLRNPQGCDILRRLAEDADLLIENYAPGVLDRLGLSAEALAQVNPGLVYISMGAFGSAGPWSGFRAYGSTTEQASGMPFLHGRADWPPAMQHTAYGDPIAGIYAAAAALIALYGRGTTGAVTIDLSQVECLFQLAADGIIAQSATGAPPPRTGSARATSFLRDCFRCAGADAWVAVDIDTPDRLEALSRATGIALPAGPPRATAVGTLLNGWTVTWPAWDAAQILQHAGIAAGPVAPATDLLQDPQLAATGFWQRGERRFVGTHVVPRAPYAVDGKFPPIDRPAPTLGEHNAEVLGKLLGLPASEVAALERGGIIGTRPV
jgi:crotonobetainyl-CoA:carnitine CoA-transferase CaiB-like acyl-CoA transferase